MAQGVTRTKLNTHWTHGNAKPNSSAPQEMTRAKQNKPRRDKLNHRVTKELTRAKLNKSRWLTELNTCCNLRYVTPQGKQNPKTPKVRTRAKLNKQ